MHRLDIPVADLIRMLDLTFNHRLGQIPETFSFKVSALCLFGIKSLLKLFWTMVTVDIIYNPVGMSGLTKDRL